MSTEALGHDLVEHAAKIRMAVVPLARRLRQQAETPFTPTELSVMGSIHRHGPLSLGDLAGRERLSLPTISRAIAVLEAEGVVERLRVERDRRVCRVQTTTAGGQWIEEGRARRNAWLAERLAALTPDERAVLAAAVPLLERLIDEHDQ